ncbi:MAG: hypothetical protein GY872_19190 [Roseibacillus sp.]|nr:hypothetical protein [Roseibacillus sp.]
MSTENIEALLGPRQSFEDILGPAQGFENILGPPQTYEDIYAEPVAPPVEQLTREQFLQEMGRLPPAADAAPPAPAQATAQPQTDGDTLGLELPITRQQELQAAYKKEQEIRGKHRASVQTSDELKRAELQKARSRMMERHVTAEGTDIGSLFESDILLHTDGYVRGEDGAPRKASGMELLIQSLGRQTLYAGFGYEQEVARLRAQRRRKFDELVAGGMERRDAYAEVDSIFHNVMTKVDTERREIRETFTGAALRNTGLASAFAGEFLYDTLPYFYEVDADGGLQNPDSYADQFAQMLDQARTAGVEAGYFSQDTADTASKVAAVGAAGPLAWMTLPAIGAAAVAAGGDFLDVVPIPFSAIDRDTETSMPESGMRVAASTGGFLGDVAMANSRGRGMPDEVASIPSYREKLGENQWLSMGPGLVMEAAMPGGPVHMLQLGGKVAKFAALSGKLGTTAKQLAEVADVGKWAQAYRVGAEFSDALGADGTIDVADVVRRGGEPARVVAKQSGAQLSTPYKMLAVVDNPESTVGELASFGDTEIGDLIIRRAVQKADPERMRVELSMEDSQPIGQYTRDLVQEAVQDWRIGLEAGTIARALHSGSTDAAAVQMRRVLYDTAGLDATTLKTQHYREAFQLADEGAPAAEIIAAYKKAAFEAGAAPINATHVRVRQLLAMSDEAVRLGVKAGLKVDGPLSVFMRAASNLTDAPDTVKFGSGLQNLWTDGLEELVDIHMPRGVRFVTDRLMVPTKKVTPSMMREVGASVRAIYKPRLLENGRYTLAPPSAAGADAAKAQDARDAAVDRLLPVLDSVLPQGVTRRVFDTVLNTEGMTLKEHAFIEDAVREAAWRKVLGADEAVVASLEGRTTAQASERLSFTEEVLNPLLDSIDGSFAIAERVATRTGNLLSKSAASRTIVDGIANYTRRWNVAQSRRWLMSSSKQTPFVLRQVTEKLANEVGLVQKAYRARLQNLVRKYRSKGEDAPGVLAVNEYSVIKWGEIGEDAARRFDKQVAQLHQQVVENAEREPLREVPTRAELAAQVLYDQYGITSKGRVGDVMEYVRDMAEPQQEKFIKVARLVASRAEKRRQWSNIMQAFFTKKKHRKDVDVDNLLKAIDANLDEAIVSSKDAQKVRRAIDEMATKEDGQSVGDRQLAVLDALVDISKSAVLPPTSDNVQRVIDSLRKVDPRLEGRGAAVRSMKAMLIGDDATLRTAQTWQMSADRQLSTSRIIDDFIDQHPEFTTSLSPNVMRDTEDFYDARQLLYQAPVAVQESVLSAIYSMEKARDLTEGKTDYWNAVSYVSNGRGIGRASTASPELPTVMSSVDGRQVKVPTKRGPLWSLTKWAEQEIRNFGPRQRSDTAASVFGRMMQEKTLYPSSVGRVGSQSTRGLDPAVDALIRGVNASTRMPDPQSKYLVRAILRLRESGLGDSDIKSAVMDAVGAAMTKATVPFIENQVRNTMRGWGFSSFGTPGSFDNIVLDLIDVPSGSFEALPIPPAMGDLLKEMRLQAASGSMLDALEDLHARTLLKDRKYGEFVFDQLASFARATNQMTAYGLLSAGIVLGGPLGALPAIPLTRYIGLNVLTAPMMMVGTLGVKRAAEALTMVPGQVKAVVRDKVAKAFPNTVVPRAADDVVFRDLYGKEWTQQEFDRLCEAYNIFMSRAEVDTTANVFKTIQRDLGIYATKMKVKDQEWWQTVEKANKGRQALAWMDPTREAIGMQFAVWTDNVFRRGAFAAAIRDGETPMEAAKIARASVLDYGAVPDSIKNGFNRYLLFATFRAASTSEIIRSVFAGRDTWLKVLKLQMRMHQAAGTWTFGSDHEKVRSFTMPGPSFDNRRSAVAGPQEVLASGATDIIDFTMFGTGVLAAMAGKENAAGDIMGRIADGITEENIQPFLQAAIAGIVHSRPTSRGRLVNDSWVVSLKQAGLWDWARKRYSIDEVSSLQDRDERRPGAPEFGGVQFVFTGTGYRDFQVDSYLATVLTVNRASQDWAKSIGVSVYPPGGYDPKYRAIVPFYAYMPGLATPLRMKSPEDIHRRALRTDEYQ